MNVDSYDTVIYFDTETSGLDPASCDIIQFAYIAYKKGKFHQMGNVYFKPATETSLPAVITEITGITDEFLRTYGVDRKTYFMDFFLRYPITQKNLFVAHNALFDVEFLYRTCNRLGMQFPCTWDILDTLTIFRDRAPYPHKLSDAILHYQLKGEFILHDASGDVGALPPLIAAMKLENDDLSKYINVVGYNPKYSPRPNLFRKVRLVPQKWYPCEKKAYEL